MPKGPKKEADVICKAVRFMRRARPITKMRDTLQAAPEKPKRRQHFQIETLP
jgi:hypothetical protein